MSLSLIPGDKDFFPGGKAAQEHMFAEDGGRQGERVFPGTAISPASVSRGLGQQTGHSEATF